MLICTCISLTSALVSARVQKKQFLVTLGGSGVPFIALEEPLEGCAED